MEAYEEVVKSCRICRCEYSEDFVELLCNETLKLSAVGQLYEELLGLKINLETFNYLPQYLCKSCDLQISLFGELKLKALETAGMLRDFCQNAMQYQATSESEEREECNNFEQCEAIYANEMETITDCSMVAADEGEESWETTTETSELMVECVDEELVKCELNETEQTEGTTDSTDKPHIDTEYVDVFYLDDALMQSNNDSVDNKSNGKQLIVQKKYKKSTLTQTYPCNECPKKFKTAESQQAHINIAHLKVPAYQCNLCPKTFNQKVHYQYHMDRHNNLRNFKCEICEKAFLSKTDLSIHMRFHRGDRPYKCEICGKDYSLMQHLKSHMYSHNPTREIMCRLCQQLFTNPTTLRTHMLTIHESPRFKCEYCVKRFRRKHHLIAHTKVHEKQFLKNDEEITQNTADEEEEGRIIDDNGLSTEFTEENFQSDSLPSGVVENNIGEVFSITYSYEDFNTESYNDDDGFCENGQNIIFN